MKKNAFMPLFKIRKTPNNTSISSSSSSSTASSQSTVVLNGKNDSSIEANQMTEEENEEECYSNMTTMGKSEPPSQPESLDLDYDMWQGQFEFVGTNNNNNNKSFNIYKYSSQEENDDNLEDLNLINISLLQDISKKPILIDEETFLSLNPSDFIDSGPNSTIFIEDNNHNNKLMNNNYYDDGEDDSSLVDSSDNHNYINNFENNNKILNNINNNSEITTLNNNNNKIFNKQNCHYKIENLKNYKNKLISDLSEKQQQQVAINFEYPLSSEIMNGFTVADICENFSEQLELLQRQFADLADSQNTVEDKTTRTETKYAGLQTLYHKLEDQYRESELRNEERLEEEKKLHRELLTRAEREIELQNANCEMKIQTIEIETNTLKKDAERLKVLCDRQARDLHATEEDLEVARDSIESLKQEMEEILLRERKRIEEKKNAEDSMLALSKELERLKSEIEPALPTTSPEALRLEELHKELDELRHRNKNLEEQNEELLATVLTKGVEECQHVLNGTSNNLAQELGEMTQAQDSVDSATLASLSQLEQAFKDKEEENERLKYYIDTILVNIVENYPQLLELHALREPRTPPKQKKT